jgi:nucleoside 2-deoxyribosyltransferase
MNIYFAGSIRGGCDDQKLYLEIIELLRNYGEVLTEHIGDADLSYKGEQDLSDREIYDRDLAWLSSADVVIAEVTTPSLGVGYEIGKATEWQKPLLCLFRPRDGSLLSAMLTGSPDIKVCEYQTIGELIAVFDDFFAVR